MTPTFELAQYRLNPGTSISDLQQALGPLHTWLVAQPGCLGIQSYLHRDGVMVTDVVAWRSEAEAQAAMDASGHEASLADLLPLVQPDSFACAYGVLVAERQP